MKNVVFRREIMYNEQRHRNLVDMHACKVLPFSVTNESAFKITSAIHVPNLVKIGETLHPLALTEDKVSSLHKSIAANMH